MRRYPTLAERVEVERAAAVPDIFLWRSGLNSRPLSDDAILRRANHRRKQVNLINEAVEPHSMFNETLSEAMRQGFELAMADPASSPEAMGRLEAEDCRESIRSALESEAISCRPRMAEMRDFLANNGLAISRRDPNGPVFRRAFLGRYRLVLDQEIERAGAACEGR